MHLTVFSFKREAYWLLVLGLLLPLIGIVLALLIPLLAGRPW